MDYRVEEEFADYPGNWYLIVEKENGFYSILKKGNLVDAPIYTSLTYDEAYDKKRKIIEESR